jgi:hypothetical protein
LPDRLSWLTLPIANKRRKDSESPVRSPSSWKALPLTSSTLGSLPAIAGFQKICDGARKLFRVWSFHNSAGGADHARGTSGGCADELQPARQRRNNPLTLSFISGRDTEFGIARKFEKQAGGIGYEGYVIVEEQSALSDEFEDVDRRNGAADNNELQPRKADSHLSECGNDEPDVCGSVATVPNQKIGLPDRRDGQSVAICTLVRVR